MFGALLGTILAPMPRSVRVAAVRASRSIRGLGIELLADPDPTIRFLAIDSAARPPCPGSVAEQIGRIAARDDDRRVRRKALEALKALGAGALPALPALKELLRDPDAARRRRAMAVVAAIGPAAASVIQDARRLGHDKNAYVSEAATAAIKSITLK